MPDLFGFETPSIVTSISSTEVKPVKASKPRQKKAKAEQLELFDIEVPTQTKVKDVVKKVKEPAKVDAFAMEPEKALKSKKVALTDKLTIIRDMVFKILGKQKDNTVVIKNRTDFHNYITAAIASGRLAVDTETNNSLDPITCKIMGLCLYYPGSKQAYIPINHVNPETGEKLAWQCTESDIREELQRVVDAKTFIVMHNGKFDYKVIYCTCGIEVKPDWDTLIASKLIDENEKSAGLKIQYISKIDPSQEKYSIDHLFAGIEYAQVDPEVFALYAATDSMMTDKLYLWQKPVMESYERDSIAGKSIYDLFREVEMPCVIATASMELNGVLFDTEYAGRLKKKFEAKLAVIDAKIDAELKRLEPTIKAWRETPEANYKDIKADYAKDDVEINGVIYAYHPSDESTGQSSYWYVKGGNTKLTSAECKQLGLKLGGTKVGKSKAEQLSDPISMSSPTQLAILLYDILGCDAVDKDSPRSTGETALEALKKDVPLCDYLLERRGIVKLLDAFINSLPENVNPKTGKIHGSFNQYGAATGRFSSSEPNLQQIPSHEKSIRMLFRADPGYVLVGSDFSQQEPRLLSFYSRDENMINAYKNGKDLYATIATGVYHMDYWDCMEHHEDGSPNPEGKKRRASCKAILLGIMYGRGAAAIAEQIHGTKEEAQEIVNNFYKSFPIVKKWMNESLDFLKEHGYVEDYYGRRRRLTDIQLPNYEVRLKDEPRGDMANFNPFLICGDRTVKDPRVVKWENKIAEAVAKADAYYRTKDPDYVSKGEISNKRYDALAKEALKDGVLIFANTGRKAQAERQCVNARIQGGAATMTKIAMNKIYADPILKSYDYHMLIGVHDELIGQCKEEYAEQCAERLCTIMKTCVSDIIDVPFKCDPAITHAWYEDEMSYQLQDTYKELQANGMSEEDAFNKLVADNCEFLPEQIKAMLAFE